MTEPQEPQPQAEPQQPQQPQVPPPPYGYPVYQQPYVAQPPVNTYAILATVFAFVVFAPLGIYFGRKAKEQIAVSGERGIELANVGVIAGWIFTCLYGLFMLVWCGFALTIFFGGLSTSP